LSVVVVIQHWDDPQATEIRHDRKTRGELKGWLPASTTEQRMVRRARIVLLAADGWASRAIAREVGVMTGVVVFGARALPHRASTASRTNLGVRPSKFGAAGCRKHQLASQRTISDVARDIAR
jgi:hypothetical protein